MDKIDIAKYEIQKEMGRLARHFDDLIQEYANTHEVNKKNIELDQQLANARYIALSNIFETIFGYTPLYGDVKKARYK